MTAALILAAGSVAENIKFDPAEPIGGASPLHRLISIFHQAGVDRTIVVTGRDAERIERHCSHTRAIFLRNEKYEEGDMLASVKIGLKYIKNKYDRVFIAPVKVSFFTAETLALLLASQTDGVAIPVRGVNTGQPLLVAASAFDEILDYNGPNGLQGVLASNTIPRRFVDVTDDGVLLELNDETYEDLPEDVTRLKVKSGVKVTLNHGRDFFGPGALKMLTLIDETGSKLRAASHSGMSYSKCRSIISNIENALGYPILDIKMGGAGGGSNGVKITAKCRELMRRYEALMKESEAVNRELFEKHFGDVEDLW